MFRLTDLLVLFPLAVIARLTWAAVRRTRRPPLGRLIVDALFMTYLVSLAEIVVGFGGFGGLDAGFSPWSHVNLLPLRSIGEIRDSSLRARVTGQVIGNVLLFVPLGALLPMMGARFRSLKSVLATGLILSASIELAQLGLLLGRLMDRAADVDDVLLNTLGALAGYLLWALLSRALRRRTPEPSPATSESEGVRVPV